MVRAKQTLPGTEEGMRRITGLNTDRTGKVSYSADDNQHSHAVRNEKIHHVRRALTVPEMFGKDTNEILVVGWGSTRGAVEEAIALCEKQGVPASGMNLRIVYPLPMMLKDIFAKYKKVMTIEVAYGDKLKPSPLALLLRAETLKDVHPLIAEATGRPVRPRIILKRIQEALK
jgi:2-oxoglutarate ferredoxin oxidoreductase subunit alpha